MEGWYPSVHGGHAHTCSERERAERSYDTHLVLQNRKGSVEHYYHFIFGYLIPLVHSMATVKEVGNARRLLVRSCAIFDSHLSELRYPSLTILDREAHHEVARRRLWQRGLELKQVAFAGFDDKDHYDAQVFRKVAANLSARLLADINLAREDVDRIWDPSGPKILLINRGPPDPYYLSDRSETKGSGRQRRAIANFEQLRDSLTAAYPNARVALLEGQTLAYQIALFGAVDVVIAQHGAALANLVWAKDGIGTIEIAPRDLKPGNAPAFQNLSLCLGQRYEMVEQNDRYGEVRVDHVLAALKRLVS